MARMRHRMDHIEFSWPDPTYHPTERENGAHNGFWRLK